MVEQNVYRSLTDDEIEQLKYNGCYAEAWSSIEVAEGFEVNLIHNVLFVGRIRIGKNVRLTDIGHLENYNILNNVTIERVGELAISAEKGCSTMGQGVEVATMNENRGRSVAIFGKLTAQIAYIEAMYRHRPEVVERMHQWAQCNPRKFGSVGTGTTIRDCGSLRDLTTTFGVKIKGAAIIHNSTLYTNAAVGAGAKIYSSIVARRGVVDNGTLLERCFVGEGSILNNFTATDSLFFSNCELFNGEAVSIFAAPYTVSHHKSSLLIAGMFSFFNAGSGANQSNHLFKTGAVHQGIHRRGVKFASNAYVMLPAVEGAFTTVIGRHKKHHNTENLPYSHLVEGEGDSWVRPAMNLTSSGMLRDFTKWSKRDCRTNPNSADIINFETHNPFLTERIGRAIAILEKLWERGEDICTWERIKIRRPWIDRGLKLYRLAWDMYVGRMLEYERPKEWLTSGVWLDVAGMYMSRDVMEDLLTRIEAGEFGTADDFTDELQKIYAAYPQYAYCWAYDRLAEKLGCVPTNEDVRAAIERGQASYSELKKMCSIDQQKDFSALMHVGYGLDWGDDECIEDFRAVRL